MYETASPREQRHKRLAGHEPVEDLPHLSRNLNLKRVFEWVEILFGLELYKEHHIREIGLATSRLIFDGIDTDIRPKSHWTSWYECVSANANLGARGLIASIY